jgi:hypothetical protein
VLFRSIHELPQTRFFLRKSCFIENLKHHGVSEEIINIALKEMIH